MTESALRLCWPAVRATLVDEWNLLEPLNPTLSGQDPASRVDAVFSVAISCAPSLNAERLVEWAIARFWFSTLNSSEVHADVRLACEREAKRREFGPEIVDDWVQRVWVTMFLQRHALDHRRRGAWLRKVCFHWSSDGLRERYAEREHLEKMFGGTFAETVRPSNPLDRIDVVIDVRDALADR